MKLTWFYSISYWDKSSFLSCSLFLITFLKQFNISLFCIIIILMPQPFRVQAVVSELTHTTALAHSHPYTRIHIVRKLDLQPILKKLHVAETYPESPTDFVRDKRVTMTIVMHPRVRQLQYLQDKKMRENPGGNSESSTAWTHHRQPPHPERMSPDSFPTILHYMLSV
jgi:hypothetical protein